MPARSESHTHDVAVLTARVRWVVIALLLASLPASDQLLGLPVSYGVAGSAIFAVTLLNLAIARRRAPLGEGLLSLTVAADMAAIAVVLGASGGAANPMSALLLVYVALAAAMFSARAAFGLAAFAACTFGALFLLPDEASCHAAPPSDAAFSRHLYGMWAAFALVAALVAAFVVEVRRAFRARDAELEKLRATSEAAARFAAIGTLAAGVAHELGTPLATIQVLAADLEDGDVDGARQPILDQVERCRAVLRRLHPSTSGDESCSAPVDLGESVRSAVETWRAGHPSASVEVEIETDCKIRLEREDVEAALHVLLDNAHHALATAKSTEPIRVSTGLDGTRGPYMEVEDDGSGVDPSVQDRLGEPFLSTKAPGEGMGLGIYLVRTLLAELGGNIDVTARHPRGTRVRVCFGAWERVVA
jgi:two-component system, sensor histidine kinase RegB